MGRQGRGSVIIYFGSRCRKHPSPIVVLAIHKDVGNNPGDHARGKENIATLRLAVGGQKHVNPVSGAKGEWSRERKGRIAGHKEVVTGIVQDFEGVAGANNHPGYGAADGELRLRAGNLDIGNAAANGAASIGDDADCTGLVGWVRIVTA